MVHRYSKGSSLSSLSMLSDCSHCSTALHSYHEHLQLLCSLFCHPVAPAVELICIAALRLRIASAPTMSATIASFEFDGATWFPLQLHRAGSLAPSPAEESPPLPHQRECPGWRRILLGKRKRTPKGDPLSNSLDTPVQLSLDWTDEDDAFAAMPSSIPAPSLADDCYTGSLGDLLLSIRCSSIADGGSHVIWYKEHSMRRTVEPEEAARALRAYFNLPSPNAATLGTLASLLSSNASLSTPTRSTSSSATTTGSFTVGSPTLERAERETAFWQTVERIALGLKRDVESHYTEDVRATNSSSLNGSSGSNLTSTSGSSSSAFTLTAHISSTLNQIMHLHYESKELEGRIEECKETMGKHAQEVEIRTKNIHDWVHATRKQAKLDGNRSNMTEEEAKLLRRVARVLRADATAQSASSTSAPPAATNGK